MKIYKNLSLENLPNEVWKDVDGYEGLYQVSNLGRVKSFYKKGKKIEKIKTQVKDANGYLVVCITKNKNQKVCKVHRLVAKAFIPNTSNYPVINHKDEIKSNNCVDNLEWCTQKYNTNYGTCQQRRVEKKSKTVYQYSLDGILVKIWKSPKECEKNGFNKCAVSFCCNGKRKTHGGYIWSYKKLE